MWPIYCSDVVSNDEGLVLGAGSIGALDTGTGDIRKFDGLAEPGRARPQTHSRKGLTNRIGTLRSSPRFLTRDVIETSASWSPQCALV